MISTFLTVLSFLFTPVVKLDSGRQISLIGNGPPVVFSPGLFGIMPRRIYSNFINKLKKEVTIISFDDLSPISVKDIDDISKSIMADSVVFLSHSSFDNNILKSDKINHAILCDPITNPDLGFEGLKQEPIDNNYPCLIIRAEKAYSTKVPIPNFLNPNLKGEIEDITYNDVGHIDILDDFWADFAKKYGFWDSADPNIMKFWDWKKIPNSDLNKKRDEYRTFLVKKMIEFINSVKVDNSTQLLLE